MTSYNGQYILSPALLFALILIEFFFTVRPMKIKSTTASRVAARKIQEYARHIVHFMSIYLIYLMYICLLYVTYFTRLYSIKKNTEGDLVVKALECFYRFGIYLTDSIGVGIIDVIVYAIYCCVLASLCLMARDCYKQQKSDVVQWAIYIPPCVILQTHPDLLFFPLSLLP